MFVIEGEAPEVKWQTMADRQKYKNGGQVSSGKNNQPSRRGNRSHFKVILKEVNMESCPAMYYIWSCPSVKSLLIIFYNG